MPFYSSNGRSPLLLLSPTRVIKSNSLFCWNMMRMYQQFPLTQYVIPYVLFLVLLCCREVAFFNHQIVHGLPPPPFSHPESLKFWCSRHRTAWSVDQMWGISGRYSVAEDASVWGLRKSRDASQPVNLSSVNLSWYVEWFWAVVYLW